MSHLRIDLEGQNEFHMLKLLTGHFQLKSLVIVFIYGAFSTSSERTVENDTKTIGKWLRKIRDLRFVRVERVGFITDDKPVPPSGDKYEESRKYLDAMLDGLEARMLERSIENEPIEVTNMWDEEDTDRRRRLHPHRAPRPAPPSPCSCSTCLLRSQQT